MAKLANHKLTWEVVRQWVTERECVIEVVTPTKHRVLRCEVVRMSVGKREVRFWAAYSQRETGTAHPRYHNLWDQTGPDTIVLSRARARLSNGFAGRRFYIEVGTSTKIRRRILGYVRQKRAGVA